MQYPSSIIRDAVSLLLHIEGENETKKVQFNFMWDAARVVEAARAQKPLYLISTLSLPLLLF